MTDLLDPKFRYFSSTSCQTASTILSNGCLRLVPENSHNYEFGIYGYLNEYNLNCYTEYFANVANVEWSITINYLCNAINIPRSKQDLVDLD